jgi:hypothetical protein
VFCFLIRYFPLPQSFKGCCSLAVECFALCNLPRGLIEVQRPVNTKVNKTSAHKRLQHNSPLLPIPGPSPFLSIETFSGPSIFSSYSSESIQLRYRGTRRAAEAVEPPIWMSTRCYSIPSQPVSSHLCSMSEDLCAAYSSININRWSNTKCC